MQIYEYTHQSNWLSYQSKVSRKRDRVSSVALDGGDGEALGCCQESVDLKDKFTDPEMRISSIWLKG